MADINFDSEQEVLAVLKEIDLDRNFDESKEGRDRAYEVSRKFKTLCQGLRANPARVTKAIIDALVSIALNSPINDINDKPWNRHPLTGGEIISCEAVDQLMPFIQFAPLLADDVMRGLETIAEKSQDHYVREQSIWTLHHMGQNRELAPRGIAALEKQSRDNDNSLVRTWAREQLQSLAEGWNAVAVPAALAAWREGMAEADHQARASAYGNLGRMVERIRELDEPAITELKTAFEKAAHDDPDACAREKAASGLKYAQDRLARPGMRPVHPVDRPPVFPLVFELPWRG